MNTPFTIDGKPFFILGGQVHNSSGYGPESMEAAWQALAALRANTAEVPVYWEQVEPREGHFEFSHLDGIITGARQRGLRLVLLWFATWKNGSMQYVPEWVKTDPARFPRVTTPGGTHTWVLSSHYPATWEADCKAYCRLLEHLREFDGQERTVIGIQIENEPGILGSVRDYGAEAEAEYQMPVPAELADAVRSFGEGPLRTAWDRADRLKTGAWAQMFGPMAAETFSAWSIARYIDRLAEAGQAVYDLPAYTNVWLAENGWHLPGVNYPSGGPVTGMLDVWKAATPHLSLIAPDIYLESQQDYNAVCSAYERADNPLFIPESGGSLSNALNLFEAVASFHTVGYAVFGVESLLEADGSLKPRARPVVESFHTLQSMLPLLVRYHGTRQIKAVIQHEFMGEQILDLGACLGMARFADREGSPFKDFRHQTMQEAPRGSGLVVMPNERELYLAGAGFRLMLKTKQADERRLFAQANENFDGPLTNYLRVEEGHFSPDGEWVVDRMRNGDEITNGLWVAPDCGVVHAVLAG